MAKKQKKTKPQVEVIEPVIVEEKVKLTEIKKPALHQYKNKIPKPRALTSSAKSRKLVQPVKVAKPDPISSIKMMAVDFSKGLKRGLKQLRVSKPGK